MQLSHFFELIKFYYRLVTVLFLTIVGGAVAFSVFFLFVMPIYTATSIVTLLPTQAELAYSQNTVRSSSINAANLLTQTHIEYLTSREVARLAVDRLASEAQARQGDVEAPAVAETTRGLLSQLGERFTNFRREFRRIYNTLNSGKHVPLDPYTDAVLGLQDSIEIEMIEGTYILEISVKWSSPEGAAAAANVLADVYLTRARSDATRASEELEQELLSEMAQAEGNFSTLEQQINNLRLARAANLNFLRVIDPATVPIYPSFPKVIVNTVFALVGWIFVTAFTVIAIDTFSLTLKTKSDIKRVFAGRFLGWVKIKRKRPKPKQLKFAAGILRLMSDGRLRSGGVMSLGTDKESAALHKFVKEALAPGANDIMPEFNSRNPTQEVNLTKAAQPDVDSVAELIPEKPQIFTDFGGVAESFSASDIAETDWIVVGLRPGKITEPDIEKLVAELKHQGVRHVFGIFLRG